MRHNAPLLMRGDRGPRGLVNVDEVRVSSPRGQIRMRLTGVPVRLDVVWPRIDLGDHCG
ncbi:hypothetical protein [Mycolicibacterium chubuense]|uniref:Uncharacterized protein n=1 Tax=Mycolicibacterium chubuense TaxID=1800 RepID=A0A0J6WMW5_MYCCU|nr:hypothetical protein [Mycolicibacterium chubuense]KMO84725.1 hypothetical protein MCHUDSM44219_00349 [Mycolicibacterium chubuense]SPY00787.1 anaerobic dehydrogenase, typically selenocysteine-containing [Mycolicibacterium chubuense]